VRNAFAQRQQLARLGRVGVKLEEERLVAGRTVNVVALQQIDASATFAPAA
jgi:hypothetical protein